MNKAHLALWSLILVLCHAFTSQSLANTQVNEEVALLVNTLPNNLTDELDQDNLTILTVFIALSLES